MEVNRFLRFPMNSRWLCTCSIPLFSVGVDIRSTQGPVRFQLYLCTGAVLFKKTPIHTLVWLCSQSICWFLAVFNVAILDFLHACLFILHICCGSELGWLIAHKVWYEMPLIVCHWLYELRLPVPIEWLKILIFVSLMALWCEMDWTWFFRVIWRKIYWFDLFLLLPP